MKSMGLHLYTQPSQVLDLPRKCVVIKSVVHIDSTAGTGAT